MSTMYFEKKCSMNDVKVELLHRYPNHDFIFHVPNDCSVDQAKIIAHCAGNTAYVERAYSLHGDLYRFAIPAKYTLEQTNKAVRYAMRILYMDYVGMCDYLPFDTADMQVVSDEIDNFVVLTFGLDDVLGS